MTKQTRHARILAFPYAASLQNARLDALWEETRGSCRDLVMDYHELRLSAPPELFSDNGQPRERVMERMTERNMKHPGFKSSLAACALTAVLLGACSPPPSAPTSAPAPTATTAPAPAPTQVPTSRPLLTEAPTGAPSLSPTPTTGPALALTLTNTAFADGEMIPDRYTYNLSGQCSGENFSPPLKWEGVPTGAQSLAIVVIDPDGGDWVHWVQFGILPEAMGLPEAVGGPTLGIKGRNDFGELGYGGPCPPSGTHTYVFTLYVLDTPLSLTEGATLAEVKAAMEGHILDQAQLTGQRSR